PGDVVGLLFNRGFDQIASMLAILKTGAAYLPFHKQYPPARRQFMLQDGNVKIVLSDQRDLAEELSHLLVINPAVDINFDAADHSRPARAIAPQNLAYILYTSGSTGQPKGVKVAHQSVVNLVHALHHSYELEDNERILQFSTMSFDVSVEQIWLCFTYGHALVLIDEETIADSAAFSAYLSKQKVTHLGATPSYLEQLQIPDHSSLRRIVGAGEVFTSALAKKLHGKAPLFNAYGPTEATVIASTYKIEEDAIRSNQNIPIGRAIPNSRLLVLGKHGKQQPAGVPGQLYIAGEGLSLGYANRPELTAERFVNLDILDGAIAYDSGDTVKTSPTGEVTYLSRTDHQVKLRGFRIELGEIESAIQEVPEVELAAATLYQKDGESILVAYYVGDAKLEGDYFRKHLIKQIPAYMIPSMFMKVNNIPLNNNGKADLKALPAPYFEEGEVILPSTTTEESVVAIWAEVLKLSPDVISTTRSFFDLGGHSLKAAYLINRINEKFQVEVSLKDFFLSPDVKTLSAFVDSLDQTEVYSLPKAAIQPHYPLTSAQKRLYFIHTMDSHSLAYNMAQAFMLRGDINQQRLKYTFTRLVERHESLMTTIKIVDGEPRQFIRQQPDFSFEVYDDTEACLTHFVRPFDLAEGPLFRVGFAMNGDEEALLYLDMHHIITDGISQNILISEFIRLYNGDQLAVPELQFKDYAVWQQSDDYQKRVEKQKRFWLEKYDSMPDTLQLPYDYNRPDVPDFQGAHHQFIIDQDKLTRLREIALNGQTTLYAVTLSLYYVFLARLGNQEDVVVGTPVGGRELKDIEQMNGMFVNTLPLRQQIDYQMSFSGLVAKTGADVFFSMANQAYPFEELLEELKVERDIGRNPLFETMFSYRSIEDNASKLNNLEVIPVPRDQNVAQFDLSMDVGEDTTGLVITL
ncbi:MAG: amino acid adenylation domain-containing protein, partial [Bacteroidota bacterium]